LEKIIRSQAPAGYPDCSFGADGHTVAAGDASKNRLFDQRSFPVNQFKFKVFADSNTFSAAVTFLMINGDIGCLFGSAGWN
jgi:hypothetical protein